MTQWNYCPECKADLAADANNYPACPDGHFTKYPTPVASTMAFICNGGEYLTIRRSREPQKGMWALPGGFAQPNETLLQALLREVNEETGLTVEVLDFLGSYPSVYGNTGENTLTASYILEAENRNVTLSEENSELKWVGLDKMPELAFADCRLALQDLKKRAAQMVY